MKALTYIAHGKFALTDKPKPEILDPRDAVVRVTLGSICTSDLHIKHGSVPLAVPGITVGHEMVGVVEEVGSAVTTARYVRQKPDLQNRRCRRLRLRRDSRPHRSRQDRHHSVDHPPLQIRGYRRSLPPL